jgi:aspartyl-tRNA(Asn)/glutamyl-tRNA(Gln) amidotransferase subunit B
VPLRSKEEAFDYRYFPEPDLVPVAPDAEWVARVAGALGPMPAERRARLLALLGGDRRSGAGAGAGADAGTGAGAGSGSGSGSGGLGAAQVDQVTAVVDQGLDELVAAAVAGGAPARLALARAANEVAADVAAGRRLDPGAFTKLLAMEAGGELSATQAKEVLGELLAAGGGDPAAVARDKGFEAMSADSLVAVVAEVVAAHPDEWARYAGGEDKLTGFFTGQVMKATGGKADGKAVAAELRRLREPSPG